MVQRDCVMLFGDRTSGEARPQRQCSATTSEGSRDCIDGTPPAELSCSATTSEGSRDRRSTAARPHRDCSAIATPPEPDGRIPGGVLPTEVIPPNPSLSGMKLVARL